MKKRILSAILAITLMAGLSTTAFAAGQSFTDVSSDKWYYTWVTKAAQQGWVSGVGDGRFDPEGSVTFAQFALMLDRALYPDDIDSQPAGAQWWTAACEVAAKHALFPVTDMALRDNWSAVANTPIEREQMAQMMYNALVDSKAKLPSYDEYSEVALGINDIMDVDNYDAVATCYALNLLSGNGNGLFDPRANMTRAQACVVLCNIYGYVTGDVVGTTNPGQTVEPVVPERPADAVGGHYDISAYDVPADANKDGWITEAEVQAVLDQLRVEYPTGSHWGETTRYPGRPDGKGMGPASACEGFANLVSDRIFGTLPYYTVTLEETRVGDIMIDKQANHRNIVLNDYGKAIYKGTIYPEQYYIVSGNTSGTVYWDGVERYSDWPAGVGNTRILSRYPKE